MAEPDESSDALDDAAFCCRLSCYLDGALTPADFRTLNDELRGDPSKRAAFVRVCLVRAALVRAGTVSRGVAELAGRMALRPLPSDGPEQEAVGPPLKTGVPSSPPAGWSLDDAMILPAVTDVGDEDVRGPTLVGPTAARTDARNPRPRRSALWWYGGATMTAATVIGVGLTWSVRPRRQAMTAAPPNVSTAQPVAAAAVPIAIVTATAAAVTDGADGIGPGAELVPGRTLGLSAGAVEVTFATGATVVVRAPARVRVADRNSLAVEAGSVYAHVPPEAVGFHVIAPGLDVVDRGTNFGVRAGPGGESAEVHVFDGRVDAAGLDDGAPGVGQATPITAGHAAAHARAAADPAVTPVPFVAAGFDRDIDKIRMTVPTHGTGAGLSPGSPDPAWQITDGPAGPSRRPGPAFVVVDPRPEYAANTPGAQWVSLTTPIQSADGGDYTYRTTLDLTGFDPATVAVAATFAADDNLVDIRVNGQSVALPDDLTRGLDTKASRTTSHRLKLPAAGWQSGQNRVDVVVRNSSQVGMNYTGLQLEWGVTASPVVRR